MTKRIRKSQQMPAIRVSFGKQAEGQPGPAETFTTMAALADKIAELSTPEPRTAKYQRDADIYAAIKNNGRWLVHGTDAGDRQKDSFSLVDFIHLDIDKAPEGSHDRVVDGLKYAHVMYTSTGHQLPLKGGLECFRVIVPLAMPVNAETLLRCTAWLGQKVAELGQFDFACVDRASADINRIMYMPFSRGLINSEEGAPLHPMGIPADYVAPWELNDSGLTAGDTTNWQHFDDLVSILLSVDGASLTKRGHINMPSQSGREFSNGRNANDAWQFRGPSGEFNEIVLKSQHELTEHGMKAREAFSYIPGATEAFRAGLAARRKAGAGAALVDFTAKGDAVSKAPNDRGGDTGEEPDEFGAQDVISDLNRDSVYGSLFMLKENKGKAPSLVFVPPATTGGTLFNNIGERMAWDQAASRKDTDAFAAVFCCSDDNLWTPYRSCWEELHAEVTRQVNLLRPFMYHSGMMDESHASKVLANLRQRCQPLKEPAADIIPFSNGILHTAGDAEGDFVAGGIKPSMWLRAHNGYRYIGSEAETPLFDQLMQQLAGDNDTRYDALFATLRTILTRDWTVQKFFELVGEAGSGKSTFAELAKALVGAGRCRAGDLERMGQQFGLFDVQSAALIVCADQNEAGRNGYKTGTLKALSGGDAVVSEGKGRDTETVVFKGLVLITANQPTKFANDGGGIARRRVSFVFDEAIEQSRRDPEFIGKLMHELPGIAWRLLNQMTRSEARRSLDLWQSAGDNSRALVESNPLADFASMLEPLPEADAAVFERCSKLGRHPGDSALPEFGKIYQTYICWWNATGQMDEPLSHKRFIGALLDCLKVVQPGLPPMYYRPHSRVRERALRWKIGDGIRALFN